MRRNSNVLNFILVLVLIGAIAVFIYRWGQNGASETQQATSAQSDPSLTQQARLGPQDIYPDLKRTPGATDSDITQGNIQDNLCNPQWSTRSIRPPTHYTDQLKRAQLREYGYPDTNPRDYEEDHLIPLELGGHPRDPRNLWPEPYGTSIPDGGAHDKDRVERYLHRQVCAGRLTLDEAQRQIVGDWYQVFITSVKH